MSGLPRPPHPQSTPEAPGASLCLVSDDSFGSLLLSAFFLFFRIQFSSIILFTVLQIQFCLHIHREIVRIVRLTVKQKADRPAQTAFRRNLLPPDLFSLLLNAFSDLDPCHFRGIDECEFRLLQYVSFSYPPAI